MDAERERQTVDDSLGAPPAEPPVKVAPDEVAEETPTPDVQPEVLPPPKPQVYDVVIVGGGPGGYVAAIRAAQLGGKVALVERDEMGGTCLNRGCIPSKALLESVEVFRTIKRAREFGVEVGDSRPLFANMVQRKERIVKQLRMGVELLMENNHVHLLRGVGRLIEPHVVEVIPKGGDAQRCKALSVIIATGSSPARLPIPGADGAHILTSDGILELTEIPSSLIVVGGGAVGLEFAYLFAVLGARVTVLEMLPRLIPHEDEAISAEMLRQMQKAGVAVRLNAKVASIGDKDGQKVVAYEGVATPQEVSGALVLLATGRAPNSRHLGLEALGLKMERGRIQVDKRMRTNVAGVYAVGDVLRGEGLAHLASAEGIIAAENAMGRENEIDHTAVPRCLYTHPEVAAVGLTEAEARARGLEVHTGTFPFRASGRAVASGDRDGFVKAVISDETKKLLGVHVLGPRATDVIAEAVLALRLGATADELAETMHAHPTFAEALAEAALSAKGAGIHGG